MMNEDPELNQWLEEQHERLRAYLKPILEAPLPVPGAPSPAWNEWMTRHEKVVEEIARIHKARTQQRSNS